MWPGKVFNVTRVSIAWLICTFAICAVIVLRREWAKGTHSAFLVLVVRWILIPLLVVAVPVALIGGLLAWLLSHFLY